MTVMLKQYRFFIRLMRGSEKKTRPALSIRDIENPSVIALKHITLCRRETVVGPAECRKQLFSEKYGFSAPRDYIEHTPSRSARRFIQDTKGNRKGAKTMYDVGRAEDRRW
jgi:hypothetical protein